MWGISNDANSIENIIELCVSISYQWNIIAKHNVTITEVYHLLKLKWEMIENNIWVILGATSHYHGKNWSKHSQ